MPVTFHILLAPDSGSPASHGLRVAVRVTTVAGVTVPVLVRHCFKFHYDDVRVTGGADADYSSSSLNLNLNGGRTAGRHPSPLRPGPGVIGTATVSRCDCQ